jgi:hypothetical protein
MPIGRRQFLLVAASSPLVACHPAPPEGEPELRKPPPEPEPKPEPLAPVATQTDLDRHVESLRGRLDGRGWTVLAEPPFAVVGDGTSLQVERHAAATIRWSVQHLEAAYFDKPPLEIITIWLFETADSYERHTVELFHEAPDTPYGFYSPSNRALVMNIATGGGTLVHEIVHPYIEANFPDCPSWFNEGLASLYEQSAERDGRIVGLTNWRLAGLQAALREGRVPSFRELCESGESFYSEDRGSNYAQARYLCYWLQEHGTLSDYYERFRANIAVDPTGYATLVELVGPDMKAFQAKWERFVLGLRFP